MIIYCQQLGLIEISYCLNMNEGLPCKNIIGCWKNRVDIIKILHERFSEDDLRKTFEKPPKSRIGWIIDSVPK